MRRATGQEGKRAKHLPHSRGKRGGRATLSGSERGASQGIVRQRREEKSEGPRVPIEEFGDESAEKQLPWWGSDPYCGTEKRKEAAQSHLNRGRHQDGG